MRQERPGGLRVIPYLSGDICQQAGNDISYQPAKRLTHAGTGGPLVGYGLTPPTRCVNGKAGWYNTYSPVGNIGDTRRPEE
jgi:hypothetical protein